MRSFPNSLQNRGVLELEKDIKKCPFCHKKDSLDEWSDEKENFIQCGRCNLTMKCSKNWWTLDELIKYWNNGIEYDNENKR